jgi:hypothetical protein
VGSINLSKATRLKDVAFVCDLILQGLNPKWVVATLKTITSDHKNLQVVSIDVPFILFGLDHGVDPLNLRGMIGEDTYAGWLELDRLLVILWESYSVRIKILCSIPSLVGEEGTRGCMESLFPEVVKGGVADLTLRGHG